MKLYTLQCPECNYEQESFLGTFYEIKDGKQYYNISVEDLDETGLPLPDTHYPKIINGEEIHKCLNCNNEFRAK